VAHVPPLDTPKISLLTRVPGGTNLLRVMSHSQSKVYKFGAAIAVILVALVYLAWTGVQEGKSYYVTIKELRKQVKSGDEVYSRHLRVAGNVQPGSIHQNGTHAEFVLVEDGELLNVSYKGSEPPPDTFKDNAQALATGSFGRDGVFHANEIQAKCASKYAPQQGGAAAEPSKGY
jgi:cytochrome c-type biogenesis protein CcmE